MYFSKNKKANSTQEPSLVCFLLLGVNYKLSPLPARPVSYDFPLSVTGRLLASILN